MDDIARVQTELDGLADGQVQLGQRLRGAGLPGGEGLHAGGLVDVVIHVVDVPAPLLGDDVDRVVRLRHVHLDLTGIALGEVEEGQHHDHGHEREHQLERHVVAQLDREAGVVLAATVGDGAPDRQAPDHPHSLEDTNSYQAYLQKMKAQKSLIYSKSTDLQKWILKYLDENN